jgi:hypothetical protein
VHNQHSCVVIALFFYLFVHLLVCLFIYIFLGKQSKIQKRDTQMILFYFIEHNIFVEDEILGAIIIIDVAHVEHS